MNEQDIQQREEDERRGRLKNTLKLTAMFIITMGIALTILLYTFYGYLKHSIADNLLNYGEEVVDQNSKVITNFRKGVEKNLELLGKNKEIKDIIKEENSENYKNLMTEFENYVDTYEDINSIYFGTLNSDMYVYPHAELPDNYDPIKQLWYMKAVDVGESSWLEPYKSSITDDVIVNLVMPIYDNDKIIGVLGVEININSVEQDIIENDFGQDGYMMLADQNGNIVTHPQRDLIGKPIPIKELKEATQRSTAGTISYRWENKENIAIYSKINKLSLSLIGIMNEDEVNQGINKPLKNLILVGIISNLLISMIAGLIASRLIRSRGTSHRENEESNIDLRKETGDSRNNDLEEKLYRLEDYRTRGIITEEEYENKRRNIIENYDI